MSDAFTPASTAGESGPGAVRRYHDGTKHHFHRFARSLGYLDWASQPHPFRSFAGAPGVPLFPSPAFRAGGAARPPLPDDLVGAPPRPSGSEPARAADPVAYSRLFAGAARIDPVSAPAIGDFLRHALGLSAWKQYRESRWSLRVNPSSGNLHPTEAYVVSGPMPGLSDRPAVYHYAPDRHALERRATFADEAWTDACGEEDPRRLFLVALTSIHWRESWKYGERAFRYCQHDLGHAVAALALSAAMFGWRARVLASVSHRAIAAITGTDRDQDFVDAEREEPGCLIAIGAARLQPGAVDRLAEAARRGAWSGRASRLSDDHVQWTFIDEIARATEDPGRAAPEGAGAAGQPRGGTGAGADEVDARALILRRRSALAFDGRSSVTASSFFGMLGRVMPCAAAPWNALWWTPRVHLALFVHRVEDVAPGLYVLARSEGASDRLRAALLREFLWEPAAADVPLFRLARGDCRGLAARLSCDQEIAADGFFSLGMLAEFDASLDEHGAAFYRHLYWETGVVGQVLYLEAEAAGARATGIGCFYDDPVHEVLGIAGHAWQSLYHFTVGMPVEDTRLTTERGYPWG